MGAKGIPGQLATVGFVVRHDDRFDAAAGQGGDGRQADCPRADDDGDLARLDLRRSHVELADGERVGQRDGVAANVTRNRFGPASETTSSSPKLPWASGC